MLRAAFAVLGTRMCVVICRRCGGSLFGKLDFRRLGAVRFESGGSNPLVPRPVGLAMELTRYLRVFIA